MTPKQEITALDATDVERLEAQRSWVRDHYDPASRGKYDSLAGKLHLLHIILRSKWIEPTETAKLQCLGIAFGDALAQDLPFEWVAVTDENGRDPALRYKGTDLLLFPLTMISKRVENGEEVDVVNLYEGVCERVESIISESR